MGKQIKKRLGLSVLLAGITAASVGLFPTKASASKGESTPPTTSSKTTTKPKSTRDEYKEV